MLKFLRSLMVSTPRQAVDGLGALQARCAALEHKVDYLNFTVSRQAALIRHLAAESPRFSPDQTQTRASFDFQWSDMPDGDWMSNRPELRDREPGLVCKYTGLPADWFDGKRVLDAGCGSGRFSWAMASLGARVTALDQSAAGVEHTRSACAAFGDRVDVRQHNLLDPLPSVGEFDLVWSYGVLHHTGDTFKAFQNVSAAVAPGGYIFLMIYGEPRPDQPGDFYYYAEVERLRRRIQNKPLAERWRIVQELKADDSPGGWFDAASPIVNDLYSFPELESWLLAAGFEDVHLTLESSNHFVLARRPAGQ